MFKLEITLDCHNPRLKLYYCLLPHIPHFSLLCTFKLLSSVVRLIAVFRIHDILVWIRIRGSMPLTNGQCCGTVTIYYGSGSGSDF
jgi:hypothetical protein